VKVLELFSGTASFGQVAKARGHELFLSGLDPQFEMDYCVDIREFDPALVPWQPDVIWASPPCDAFSVVSIRHHWTGGEKAYVPNTPKARGAITIVEAALDIIEKLQPKVWIMENPRGLLRIMPFMQSFRRYTVTYCQYGENRMKPTDLWSNVQNFELKPPCNNGDSCHDASPRGTRVGGVMAQRNQVERSKVPPALCESLLEQIEKSTLIPGVQGRIRLAPITE
jgi:hypothetical protein